MSEDKYDKKGKPNIPKSTYKDGDYQRLAETIMGKTEYHWFNLERRW